MGGELGGLTSADMLSVLAGLSSVSHKRGGNFFKSMTTYADHAVWQDVYHVDTPNGKVAYVKITERSDGAPVIRFKEK